MPSTGTAADLLWTACRPHPDPAAVAASAEHADLESAAEVAVAQRVAPLLERALRAASVPTEGTTWGPGLHADAQRCRAQALLLLPRLGPLAFTPLVEAGLEPLVMKGAALADRYPEPGLRPMTDVDVMLPRDQHPRAIDALIGAGWREAHIPGRDHYETPLVHPELPGLPLELHRALSSWRERIGGPTGDELWGRRRPATVAGVPAFALAPEDELVALAAHAGKPFHCFARLLWIVDLVVVADGAEAAGTPIDWDRVAREAHRTGCTTVLAVALAQAARLGLRAPEELRRPRRRALEPLLDPSWPVAGIETGARYRLRFALPDHPTRQLAVLVGALTEHGLRAAPRRAIGFAGSAFRRWRARRPRARATTN